LNSTQLSVIKQLSLYLSFYQEHTCSIKELYDIHCTNPVKEEFCGVIESLERDHPEQFLIEKTGFLINVNDNVYTSIPFDYTVIEAIKFLDDMTNNREL